MKPRTIAVLALLVAGATPTRSSAQGLGRLVVTLRDTENGDTLIRGSVCANITYMSRCAPERGGSRFTIEHLPFYSYALVVGCGVVRGFPKQIGQSPLKIRDTATTEVTLDVSFKGCDMRPMRRVTGTMSGAYLTGFEEGRIMPCRPNEWFISSDSSRMTWLESVNDRVWHKVKWPKPGKIYFKDENGKQVELQGTHEYFVTVHGTLEGPDHYGHMGVAAFRFVVDEVISVRTPTSHDCR